MSTITDALNMADGARQTGHLDLAIRILIAVLRDLARDEEVEALMDAAHDAMEHQYDTDQDWRDACALDRGTYRGRPDPRDEYDGGVR